MSSNFLATVDVIEFQTAKTYFILDLTDIMYSTYKQCGEDNLKVME
jgi:hypothetical protein